MPHGTKMIKIPAYDGDAFGAYIAMPETTPAPAVIVIQEIFGINQELRDKCDSLAEQGYIAICPDLFWRIEHGIELVDSVPEQLERAFDLFGQFDTYEGIEDLKTTLGYVRNMKECNGKVGSVGYCLGGKLSYMLAAHSDIDASVSYYGVNIETLLDLKPKIDRPLLMHMAGADEFVPAEAQEKIIESLETNKNITIHRYEGLNHAFARGQGMHYDEAGATLANERTTAFLHGLLF